jgi:dihydrofolate synthase/folylpolyglutamate synthase
VLPGRPTVVLDVAHNPHAAERLRDSLMRMGTFGTTYAVLGMLKDKDVAGVARTLVTLVDRWVLAPLPGARGASTEDLRGQLTIAGVAAPMEACTSVAAAYRRRRPGVDETVRPQLLRVSEKTSSPVRLAKRIDSSGRIQSTIHQTRPLSAVDEGRPCRS